MYLKYVPSHRSGKPTAGNVANNEPQSNPLRRDSSRLPYCVAKEGASMSPSALSPVLMPSPLDGLTPADPRKPSKVGWGTLAPQAGADPGP